MISREQVPTCLSVSRVELKLPPSQPGAAAAAHSPALRFLLSEPGLRLPPEQSVPPDPGRWTVNKSRLPSRRCQIHKTSLQSKCKSLSPWLAKTTAPFFSSDYQLSESKWNTSKISIYAFILCSCPPKTTNYLKYLWTAFAFWEQNDLQRASNTTENSKGDPSPPWPALTQ